MKTMICMTLALFTASTAFGQTTVKTISSGFADDTVKVIESGFADITVKFVRDQNADIRIAYTTDKSKADVIISRSGFAARTVKVIDSGYADTTIKISDSGFSDITIGVPTSGKVHALIYTEDGFFERRDVIGALLPVINVTGTASVVPVAPLLQISNRFISPKSVGFEWAKGRRNGRDVIPAWPQNTKSGNCWPR